MAQVHVLTGPERRRRFSVAEKRSIVALAFAPGAVVSEVARQADVFPSLIYRWRRELGTAGGFAEVVVAPIGDDRSGHPVDHGCGELRCLPASAAVDEAHSGLPGLRPRLRSRSRSTAVRGCGFPHRSRRTWRRR